jgi:ABC-2 type transport system ATP-binding protein
MIRADRLSKAFGRAPALSDVTFQIARGEAVLIAGAHRSGRTTLLRILASLTPPSSGAAQVDGLDVVTHAFAVRLRVFLVGGLALAGRVHDSTVSEYLMLIRRTRAVRGAPAPPAVDALLERSGLRPDAPVNALSLGERRRLDLAAAIAANSTVLLLDEPFAIPDADVACVDALIGEAQRRGTTILATAPPDAAMFRPWDRTLTLDSGRLTGKSTGPALSAAVRQPVGA